MDTQKLKFYKYLGLAVLIIIFIFVSVITIITYGSRDMTNANPLFYYAAQNHLELLFIMIMISIILGFFISGLSFRALEKQRKNSENILQIVLMFLNKEEEEIIQHLVKTTGETTQAEISRLPGLNRVKAYRSLQKMQEKKLIMIKAHGKIRKVILREDVLDILKK